MSEAENVIQVTELTFEADVIQRSYDVPVVVDFWAPWCGPCHMLTPILERLAADPAHNFVLAKVNVDSNPNLSVRFQVQGIPAVKAFREGQVVSEFTGAQSEGRVRQFIQKVAPSDLDKALNQANSLLVTRHWAEAEAAYRVILRQRPNLPLAHLNLARALIGQGNPCEALPHLEKCNDGAEAIAAQKLWPLADYLCRVDSQLFDDEPDAPMEAQYQQAARLWLRGNAEAALDGLLDVLRQQKRFRKGEPRLVLLGIFELLGDDDPLTQTYRRELASVLF